MKFNDLIDGLKAGTITILDNKHITTDLLPKLERQWNHWNDMIIEYTAKVKYGELNKFGVNPSNMLEMYKRKVDDDLTVGYYLDHVEMHCHDCEATMYVILLSENLIGYIDWHRYWEIADASGTKYGYRAKLEDFEECIANHLRAAGKITAEINFPSGNMIFRNYFQNMNDTPESEKWSHPGLNSILGRDKITKYLANQGAAYGQMGNMSVTIYSNGRDEIIVGRDKDTYEDDLHWYEKHPEKINDEARQEIEDAKAFEKMLYDGGFKKHGRISLSVWRWMAADEQTLQKVNEKPLGAYEDEVKVKMEPGTYHLEHYYDFPVNGDFLYSRMKLIS